MNKDLLLINTVAFLRSVSIGLTGVVVGIYLFRNGFSSLGIGLVIGAGLAGAAVATVVVTLQADHLGRRPTLFFLSLLSSIAGISMATTPSLPLLLVLAFVGMLNGMGTDRSAAFALEQAIIPGLVPDTRRTWTLAWYNVVLDTGGAVGALAAGLPLLLERWSGLSLPRAYQAVFLGYAAINVLTGLLYLLLSRTVELAKVPNAGLQQTRVSPGTRSVITKLAGLFSLDALGGGLLTDALLAYWFFRRFGVSEESLGILFFVVRLLNALSHLGAAWLARRIGLVNTMVFTHLPSSLFLLAVPFAPSFKVAVALLLCREALVEMDVPTRQSYVASVVQPNERTFASGVTNLVRNVFWAFGSSLAGFLMQSVAFSAPLVLGSGLKISYDMILYRAFRKLRPPEEQGQPHAWERRSAWSFPRSDQAALLLAGLRTFNCDNSYPPQSR
ncbi:MAG: MFS transporter [Acidobacteria bacterium]|nr:MAG: MFS transporter [Acidobacteriota bacterium]